MNREEYAIMFNVEDRHWWYRGLRALLADSWRRHVPQDRPRILDVGCGTGALMQWLPERGDATGVDYALDAIDFCRERGLTKTAVGSVQALPFAQSSFDVAVSFDVLYHQGVPDRLEALRQIHASLRPGGVLFLNLPAYQWLYSSHDVAVHTAHRFTRQEVLRLLEKAFFLPVEATYWNTLLFPPIVMTRLWRKWRPPAESDLAQTENGGAEKLFSLALAVERRMIRYLPLPFGLSIFVAARKP